MITQISPGHIEAWTTTLSNPYFDAKYFYFDESCTKVCCWWSHSQKMVQVMAWYRTGKPLPVPMMTQFIVACALIHTTVKIRGGVIWRNNDVIIVFDHVLARTLTLLLTEVVGYQGITLQIILNENTKISVHKICIKMSSAMGAMFFSGFVLLINDLYKSCVTIKCVTNCRLQWGQGEHVCSEFVMLFKDTKILFL